MKDWATEHARQTRPGHEVVRCGPIYARHELMVLVMLCDYPRYWTVEEAAEHLKLTEPRAAMALNKLWLYEFVARSGTSTRRTFKFAPQSPELAWVTEDFVRRWNWPHHSRRSRGEVIVRFDDVLN